MTSSLAANRCTLEEVFRIVAIDRRRCYWTGGHPPPRKRWQAVVQFFTGNSSVMEPRTPQSGPFDGDTR
jgi:hypothetical protein